MSQSFVDGLVWTGRGPVRARRLSWSGDGHVTSVDDLASHGDSARLIIPGLVNAHVHLDLSWERPEASLAGDFESWLLHVHAERQRLGRDGLLESAKRGVRESLASGVTAIVDYDASLVASPACTGSPIRRVLLRELIAFDEEREKNLIVELSSYLGASGGDQDGTELRGVAPHAPYTTRPRFRDRALGLAKSTHLLASMHVAEQPYEHEFLEQGTGPIRAFFERIDVDPDFVRTGDPDVVGNLTRGGHLDRSFLLIHGNQLTAAEIETLSRTKATVVFCPRSHRFFGHENHPLPQLLDAGVRCAIGTDGRLSAGSLSILDELREVRRVFPTLAAERILALATSDAHAALEGRLGTGHLDRAAPADFIEIEFKNPVDPATVLDHLLAGEGTVRQTWIAGQPATP